MLSAKSVVAVAKSVEKILTIKKPDSSEIININIAIIDTIVEIHTLKLCRISSTLPFECLVKYTPENIPATKKQIVNKSLILQDIALNTNTKNPVKVETELKIYTAGRIKIALKAKRVKSEMSIPRIPLIKNRVAVTPTDHTKAPLSEKATECLFFL